MSPYSCPLSGARRQFDGFANTSSTMRLSATISFSVGGFFRCAGRHGVLVIQAAALETRVPVRAAKRPIVFEPPANAFVIGDCCSPSGVVSRTNIT